MSKISIIIFEILILFIIYKDDNYPKYKKITPYSYSIRYSLNIFYWKLMILFFSGISIFDNLNFYETLRRE